MTEKELIKASIKAQAIFDANNKEMTVKEYAEWSNCCERTILNRIKRKGSKIIANFENGSWRIPKIQFLDRIIKEWALEERNLAEAD